MNDQAIVKIVAVCTKEVIYKERSPNGIYTIVLEVRRLQAPHNFLIIRFKTHTYWIHFLPPTSDSHSSSSVVSPVARASTARLAPESTTPFSPLAELGSLAFLTGVRAVVVVFRGGVVVVVLVLGALVVEVLIVVGCCCCCACRGEEGGE